MCKRAARGPLLLLMPWATQTQLCCQRVHWLALALALVLWLVLVACLLWLPWLRTLQQQQVEQQ